MKWFVLFVSITVGFSFGQKVKSEKIYSKVITKHILVADGKIELGHKGQAYPVMTMLDSKSKIQAGVHENGFPLLLVSDVAIRNFGLGRVDGKGASPILVFRENDVVRMVFGLSMTESEKNPFLVHYSKTGKQTNQIGKYCESPTRVCTH